ncbi:hypothetical protein Zmor_016424 [Zophobas morio]|uniref:Mon2/Sec7/BIG1-like HDS domain-containing protein n=1 Tax=Zophobas morio TaxID=2755281 RepID=A0AA38HK45_9CUCU|nr:hypothetical protein Zmor_016424 [Zophobas morio]
MFAVAFAPCLATFSLHLERTFSEKVYALLYYKKRNPNFGSDTCTSDYENLLERLQIERDSFVKALATFTSLSNGYSLPSTLTRKNILCLKTLLRLFVEYGDILLECWKDVFRCISNLDKIDICLDVPLKELADPHKEFTKETINISKSLLRCSFEIPLDLSGDRKEVTFTKSSKDHEEYYDVMSLANAVDKIFTFSKELPSNSVVNFVTALCEISLSELSESPPRMFMLQKIVEISYYNMERIRLEWVLIWKRLGDFFYKVGCMSTNIATFAVDSLRQLSIKYLERMELDNFNFQKDFLKPFEYIICHNKSPEIQELVIHCLMHISRAQEFFCPFMLSVACSYRLALSLDKELKVRMEELVLCSFSTSEIKRYGFFYNGLFLVPKVRHISPFFIQNVEIVRLAFESVHTLLDEFTDHFIELATADVVACLVQFSCVSTSPVLSMEAVDLLKKVSLTLTRKGGLQKLWASGWVPLLVGLHHIMIQCSSLEVRSRAMTVLHEVLNSQGHHLLEVHWSELFQIICRLFDNERLPNNAIEREEWLKTTCNLSLCCATELLIKFYNRLPKEVLQEFYCAVKWCATADNEHLLRMSLENFENFVISKGNNFDKKQWTATLKTLHELFKVTTPVELVTPSTDTRFFNTSVQ